VPRLDDTTSVYKVLKSQFLSDSDRRGSYLLIK